ncbi:MAG TPA: phosphoribosylamine--glycine ligase [Acidimicrobiales bacterium]|nr:phosphoribosylamine--glycine ligase [Acidimicrobiales bacterium]
MRVCVVGSGGREHCLAAALAPDVEVVVAPGNPGIRRSGVATSPLDPEELEADLFVVGPEAPLVGGLADRLRARGRLVFGPGADGARLEGSKSWMKSLLGEAGVPTARHVSVTDLEEGRRWLSRARPPYVVKADGLAAGKGVLVTADFGEALADLEAKLSGRAFGEAGRRVVLEEALFGEELSVLAVCDGRRAVALAPAQDYKRLSDGDRGPNTGGMGAYSPVPFAPQAVVDRVMDEVVEPVLSGLRSRGVDYRGVLYAGLMLEEDGPKVVELNVRFGDPETQVVLPRLEGGLADLLAEAASGRLHSQPRFGDQAAVTVVMAADGYPTSPRRGDIIQGVEEAEAREGVVVYFAGTGLDAEGRLVSDGGRVLDVTAVGPDLATARARAYEAVGAISFEGARYRSDVASPQRVGQPAGAGREGR